MAFPQKANCTAYYNFNGNSNDATGNGNNGTDTSISYGTSGGITYAAFGGSSEILISNSSSFAFGTGSFSVSYWIKTTDTGKEIWAGRNTGSGFQMYLNGGKASGDGVGLGAAIDAGTVNDGAWHNVVNVFDRANSLARTYLDGTAGATYTLGSTTATEAINKAIGYQLYPQGTGNLTGDIGFMGWWNTVLSPTDVTTLYNGGLGLAYSSSTNWTQTCTDSISNSDTILRTIQRTLINAITVSDTFAGARVFPAILTEAVSLQSTLIRAITRTLAEALSNTDALIHTTLRTMIEATSESDTFSATRSNVLSLFETISNALSIDTKLNGSNVIWTQIKRSTSALWTHVSKSDQ